MFPLRLGVWEGLQFVIVALPGLLPFFARERLAPNENQEKHR